MACIFFYLIFEDFSRDFGQDSLSGAHRGGYMPPLVKQETLAESFYYIRQLWIINYYVKSLSNDLSNENINTGASIVFYTKS